MHVVHEASSNVSSWGV